MPWIIYRYILRELLKLLVPSALVLVIVISFAAGLKPLLDGLLDPGALTRFLLYASPTVLDFALPFAGCFASALVMSRLTADNELVACLAVGLSYKKLLLPVMVVGLVLTVGLFYLSNWVAPSFSQAVSMLLDKDITRILVKEVQKGRPMKIKGYLIHADEAWDDVPLPSAMEQDVMASRLVVLRGVAVGQLDKNGRVRRDVTAEQADAYIYHDEGKSWISLKLMNAVTDAGEGGQGVVQQLETWRVELPSFRIDSPMYMTWSQLQSLEERPEQYDRIANAKKKLVDALSRELLLQKVSKRLATGKGIGRLELDGLRSGERYLIYGQGERIKITRDDQSLWLEAADDDRVMIEQTSHGVFRCVYEAKRVDLGVEIDEDQESEPRLKMTLHDVKVHYQRGVTSRTATQRSVLELPGAMWPEQVAGDLIQQRIGQLQAIATNKAGGSEAVGKVSKQMREEMGMLENRITAEINERAASAVGCTLVLVLGAVVSMKNRGAMPLVVFFWTFLMTVGMVIIINSGANMATDPNQTLGRGLAILWGGNLLMVVAIVLNYVPLAKN